MDIVVTGIGLRTCLGSLDRTWECLINGESGIKFCQPFPDLPSFPLGMLLDSPTPLTHLTGEILADCLADTKLFSPLPDCGVVIGSSRSCQGIWEQWLRENKSHHSPVSFLDTLPHQAAVTVAKICQTGAPVLAPMAACATGIWAIARALQLLETGECQRVIAGAVETPITPLTLIGFSKMGALAKTGCYPFDRQREGLVLGEGGAMLMLETAQLAQQRNAPIYGRILGFGLTADAYHLSTPAPQSSAAIAAINHCLEQSQILPQDVDYIHAHGTSTLLNDAHESYLIDCLFPPGVAVSSTKGATGHTLGASGAIATALSLLALEHQIIPPCVGLQQPAFPLNLIAKPQSYPLDYVLCFSFGFGGQNAVLALGRKSA